MEFKIGEYIEVGIGESIYDEDGFSIYFLMDREGYTEFEVWDIFENEGNVLYVKTVDDESAALFARDNKFSDYLDEEDKDYIKKDKKYVKIELEVELPLDYNENQVDTAIADAIFKLGGQLLSSKEFKEITPNNI